MEGKQYYVQRHASGYVGNSLVWWRKGGSGYVCDLREAEVWSEEDSAALILSDQGQKYTRWPKDEIDPLIQHHIDMQDVRRLEPVPAP